MLLFKTSGATLPRVVAHQAHAFLRQPRNWRPGELVLVSKNRADCRPGERQIRYLMRIVDIRPLKSGEAEKLWKGNEGRWRYLVQCQGTQELTHAFDLDEVLGAESRRYSSVQTFAKFDEADEIRLSSFLRREPGVST